MTENPRCARNLPQHSSGCRCIARGGSATEATDVDLTRRATGPAWEGSIFEGAEIIHAYTREQAIADGVLRDKLSDGAKLSDVAAEAGIRWPVVMTNAAFTDTIRWGDNERELQDEQGRAWDVFTSAHRAMRSHAMRTGGTVTIGDRIPVSFLRIPPGKRTPKLTELHAVASRNDDGSPCFVFMLPEED